MHCILIDAHLSNGDQLAMLDNVCIAFLYMPTSPMGINWRCSIMYPIVNNIKAAVKLSGIEEVLEHSFIVVEQLISQVILGVDFLQQQGLVLPRPCQSPLLDRKDQHL